MTSIAKRAVISKITLARPAFTLSIAATLFLKQKNTESAICIIKAADGKTYLLIKVIDIKYLRSSVSKTFKMINLIKRAFPQRQTSVGAYIYSYLVSRKTVIMETR